MPISTRRDFIYRSVLATAGLGLLGCGNTQPSTDEKTSPNMAQTKATNPYLDTIGLQLWTVRDQMEQDPRATLEALADIGYRQVELMDTRSIAELKPIAEEFGMEVNSSFMLWTTITGRWDLVPYEERKFEFAEVLDQASEGGLSHLVFGYLTPGERETADDWKRVADQLNEAGERAKRKGIQMAYHNHNFEWNPVDGTTGFDILVERMDGDLIPFELDVAWAAMAGKDPHEVMRSVSDRIELLHAKNLQDLDQPYLTIEAMPEDKFEEVGDGYLDIPALMQHAKEYGVTYCMVEQDNNHDPDSLGSARKSLEYLASA